MAGTVGGVCDTVGTDAAGGGTAGAVSVVVDVVSAVSARTATTSAAVATSAIAAMIAIGRRQFGVGTMRVRAPVPHFRHQSCWGAIGEPH